MLQVKGLKSELIGPLDLSVGSGECLLVRGASGAGKSLLLRAIVDLDPNIGNVQLDNQPRDAMPAHDWRKQVALVPAESGWWADRVGLHFDEPTEAAKLFSQVGMPEEAVNWEVNRLSTGERHRLAIIRAIFGKPKILMLDEPTAALDADATDLVETLLQQQLERGVGVLMVTHDSAQAERLAAHTLTMNAGQFVNMESDTNG